MLLIGLKHVARHFRMPVHFLELGASAGLNQNFDAFFYQTDTLAMGRSDLPHESHDQMEWARPGP